MKPGSTLINAGRGDLIDQPALIGALNTGPLAHAVLDVLTTEPLPRQNPLWRHPAISITPHVSGWHLGDALKDVAENCRRLSAGHPLLHEVDRCRGY
jgi:glyoxylate/hydroxypyruvate reductase